MFQSTKTYLALVAAAVLLSNCSQNNDTLSSIDKDVESQSSSEVMFQLRTNASTSTRSAEDSYVHEQGTPDEYKVNNARVYLFDSSTKLLVKNIQLTDITYKGSDASGSVIYETGRVSVPQGRYDVFAVANTNRIINKNTEDEFLADIDSTTYVRGHIEDISNGVVMTNRGSDKLGIVIANNSTGEDNVINLTLERVLARIDIAKNAEKFELVVPDGSGTKYASVTLDRSYIVNFAKYYYSYRHTAVQTSLNPPVWNINDNFGNINDVNGYVIDPYFFKKTIDATAFTNAGKYYENFYGDYSDPKAVSWSEMKNPIGTEPQYRTTYCLENAMLAPAQKNGYSTGVIFGAKFEPNNNVYRLGTGGSLELITDPTKYPEVMYYYNYKFYDSTDALKAAIGEEVTPVSMAEHNVKIFEKKDDGYRCYYTYWIRHFDNNRPTEMGVMEFAIVRNNLYRLLITNVSGLGNDTLVPDIDIPDEGETLLQVVLNVKPWIVRNQTNIVL